MLPYRKYANETGSRVGEILAGIALGLFGLLIAVLAAIGVYRMLQRGSLDVATAIILAAPILVAAAIGVTAFRLISGRGRKSDGGLFPPWFLRVLGLLFLTAAIIIPLLDRETLTPMFGALTLAAGCFYLANRQQRAVQQLRAGDDAG